MPFLPVAVPSWHDRKHRQGPGMAGQETPAPLLVTLPLEDVEENAAMVNAIQRHASVVVQKSLAEGFGLTVAEGMWKGRPVIGSAVGGIQDQVMRWAQLINATIGGYLQPGTELTDPSPPLPSKLRTTVRAYETAIDDLTRQAGIAASPGSASGAS
jgi:glycosyltransferase involved in cell wall biosynthesis